MEKKITLKDISAKLNISQNTISLVMRDRPGISADTKKLILKTAKEMGYTMSRNTSEMNNICMISTVDNSTDTYFYIHVQNRIELKLKETGYNLISFTNIDENFSIEDLRKTFKNNYIKGIIILGDIPIELGRKLVQCDIPIVGVGFYFKELFIDTVIEDNISGMSQIVDYLYNRGYSKIGFIGSINSPMSFGERWMGYIGALKLLNLEINYNHMYIDYNISQLLDYDFIIDKFNEREDLPEVFVCANDKIAVLTTKVLYNLGYRIPKDIGIVGFDSSEMAKLTIPTLTTVDTHMNKQATMTVEKILKKIANKKKQVERIVLPVNLVHGESCK